MFRAASRVVLTCAASAMAGLALPARAPMPATICASRSRCPVTFPSLVRASITASVAMTRSNFSPASMRFCTPPAVSLTTVTLSPVRAPKSAARALTGMNMPAPVRTFRSLAEAVPASRQSAGTMIRNMPSLDPPLILRGGRGRFIRDQGTRKAKGKAMKKTVFAAAAMGLAMLSAAPATAAEYTTIILEKTVNRTPDQTWNKIGPYCAIATWLKVACVVTAGNGVSVGTNRLLNGNNNEIMIAATPYSYSYTQPATTILYHGTLAVEPIDRGQHAKIVYTLFYDQAPLGTDQAKAENRAQRTKRFNEALDAMKQMAETP